MESSTSFIMVIGIIAAFFVVFPLMWCFVLFILSSGGWRSLAKKYSTHDLPRGNLIGSRAFRVNKISYNAVVKITINTDGFFLQPMWLFRVFHPTLFIPWQEIQSIKTQNLLLIRYEVMRVGNPKVANISIPQGWFPEFDPYLSHISPNI